MHIWKKPNRAWKRATNQYLYITFTLKYSLYLFTYHSKLITLNTTTIGIGKYISFEKLDMYVQNVDLMQIKRCSVKFDPLH